MNGPVNGAAMEIPIEEEGQEPTVQQMFKPIRMAFQASDEGNHVAMYLNIGLSVPAAFEFPVEDLVTMQKLISTALHQAHQRRASKPRLILPVGAKR